MISLLVPSRGRPEAFGVMCQSALFWADRRDDIEIVLRQDEDSPYLLDSGDDWLVPLIGPRHPLSSLWNDCADAASGDILMQCADDIRFRTPGWDTLVIEAFDQYPDRIAYIYGRDGIADQRMATHGFMHRRWYETLGYFTWPHFTSDYGDLWNHTIAQRLDRLHYLPDLFTEHLHPSVGKGEWDLTHQERVERDKTDENWRRWDDAQPDLDEAVQKLFGQMKPQGSTTTHSAKSRSE